MTTLTTILLLLAITYGISILIIYKRKLLPYLLEVQGPFLLIKSSRVGIFDKFTQFSWVIRKLTNIGISVVAVLGTFVFIMCTLGLYRMIQIKPEPTGVYALKNMLVLPGVNDFVPLTFAVIAALIICVMIHEFGHGIVARVENITIKSTGIVLCCFIPIGAFVNPDDTELKSMPVRPKLRILSAGITLNLITAAICFALLLVISATCVGIAPSTDPNTRWLIPDMIKSPVGAFVRIIYTPLSALPEVSIASSLTLTPLAFGTPTYESLYTVSTPLIWEIIRFLFWMVWLNFAIGLCNAFPAIPLDGGMIAREWIKNKLDNIPIMSKYADRISMAAGVIPLIILLAIMFLPTLLHM